MVLQYEGRDKTLYDLELNELFASGGSLYTLDGPLDNTSAHATRIAIKGASGRWISIEPQKVVVDAYIQLEKL